MLILYFFVRPAGMPPRAVAVMAGTAWLDAPIPVISLLPVLLFLTFRVAKVSEVTAPYAVFAGVAAKTLGIQISFLQCILVGVPLAVIFMLVTWWLLLKLLALSSRPEDRFVVTRLTPPGKPPNRCFFVQVLKPYGVNVGELRATALAQTIQYGHLKLLTIYGLTNEGMRRYEDLAGLAQNTRKADPNPNLW